MMSMGFCSPFPFSRNTQLTISHKWPNAHTHRHKRCEFNSWFLQTSRHFTMFRHHFVQKQSTLQYENSATTSYHTYSHFNLFSYPSSAHTQSLALYGGLKVFEKLKIHLTHFAHREKCTKQSTTEWWWWQWHHTVQYDWVLTRVRTLVSITYYITLAGSTTLWAIRINHYVSA